MDEKTMKQMAKMVDALQPHCDEEIVAAMTCSHAGSMRSVLVPKLFGGILGKGGSSSRSRRRSRVGPRMRLAWKSRRLERWQPSS